MPSRADIFVEANRLLQWFETAGAEIVETSILQPADVFLDLYGEDIRARAYTTADALRGEQMLRPDFTVPIALMHIKNARRRSRYTYSGEVFRRQEHNALRENEYLQVGYEVFSVSDEVASDAEVFALFAQVLAPFDLKPKTGDMGILTAAVRSLKTTEQRKSALMRHIWRPKRFREILNRYAGRTPLSDYQAALITRDVANLDFPEFGLRRRQEVYDRIERLRQDNDTVPISEIEMTVLERLLEIKATAPVAIERLLDIAKDLPALSSSIERLRLRIDTFDTGGIDVETLAFEACYGRAKMEYYDGFIFEFMSETYDDLPPVATGGRYDALMRRLGAGSEISAVGGVIRPSLILEVSQ